MATPQDFRELVTRLKKMEKEQKAAEKLAQDKYRERTSLAGKEGMKLVSAIVKDQNLIGEYKWTALWNENIGYAGYGGRSCKSNPTPVNLGVSTDSCKTDDPIATILQKLPGICLEYKKGHISPTTTRSVTIKLEEGVVLYVNPRWSSFQNMVYIISFTDVDVADFLPWFGKNTSKAMCMSNAQTVADFVIRHNLKVYAPEGFKGRLEQCDHAKEMGEKVAGLIQMVGYKKKAPSPEEKKELYQQMVAKKGRKAAAKLLTRKAKKSASKKKAPAKKVAKK